ncbi:MAG TPA: hypothetical protein VJR89_04785, partial [Polyangiales bacterium]|nr:hypothetical protein [Polyangiales bacterium]
MYPPRNPYRALWLLVLAACTEQAPRRPAAQPGPPPSLPSTRTEPGVERASLRLGRAPAMYRLAKDAQVPLERVAPPAPEPRGFLGKPERRELEQLASDAVTSAKKGSGGRTLAFELALDSGVSAYFEPEQRASRANWYAEIAAYYLDRELGLG